MWSTAAFGDNQRLKDLGAPQGACMIHSMRRSISGHAQGSAMWLSIHALYSSQKTARDITDRHSLLSTFRWSSCSTSCTGTRTGTPSESKAQSRSLQRRQQERGQSPHSIYRVARQLRPDVCRNLQSWASVETNRELVIHTSCMVPGGSSCPPGVLCV